jgi:hypothetical protein
MIKSTLMTHIKLCTETTCKRGVGQIILLNWIHGVSSQHVLAQITLRLTVGLVRRVPQAPQILVKSCPCA